jgi:hypothetical protein
LNDEFKEGNTNFYIHNSIFHVKPISGMGIVFPHGIHESSGEYSECICKINPKYTLRTDIMFKKVS